MKEGFQACLQRQRSGRTICLQQISARKRKAQTSVLSYLSPVTVTLDGDEEANHGHC